MDRQKIEQCMRQVRAYRESGQKAKEWAAANGISVFALAGWCAHSKRWQAWLEGGEVARPKVENSKVFVAACVASAPAVQTARIEVSHGESRLRVDWPLTHARELGWLLREFSR